VCCLIPAFTAFSYRCDRSVTFWWAQFVTRIAGDRPLFGVAPGLHARPVDRRRTVQEFSALYAACRADHGAAALRRSAAILRLLEPFADLVHAEDPPEQARFAAAVERMERLGPPPRIAELARACGLSTAHFSRRFTAAFGQPPARYLLHCRLEQARRMLAEGGRTIDAIARRCGFCDGFHLSRLFRKHLGTTPSRYRERPVRPGW
jgi:AraC-like DNA-binding protein